MRDVNLPSDDEPRADSGPVFSRDETGALVVNEGADAKGSTTDESSDGRDADADSPERL